EALAGRRVAEEQRDIVQQTRLVAHDREQGVPARLADLPAERLLAVERIPADEPPAHERAHLLQEARRHAHLRLRFGLLALLVRLSLFLSGPAPPLGPAPGRPQEPTGRRAARQATPRHGSRATPCPRAPAAGPPGPAPTPPRLAALPRSG